MYICNVRGTFTMISPSPFPPFYNFSRPTHDKGETIALNENICFSYVGLALGTDEDEMR